MAEAKITLEIDEQQIRAQLASAWYDGYFFATNGKWGFPEKGDNPFDPEGEFLDE